VLNSMVVFFTAKNMKTIMLRMPQNLSWTEGHSIGSQGYSYLREQIIHPNIAPGTRLSEAEISRSHYVSRQSVREAFLKLKDEALVVIHLQKSTFITKISIIAVSDVRFVCEAIEADIVKLFDVRA